MFFCFKHTTHTHTACVLAAGYDGMVVVWDVVSIKTQAPHMIAKFRVTRSSSLNPALSSLNPALSLTHQFSGVMRCSVKEGLRARQIVFDPLEQKQMR